VLSVGTTGSTSCVADDAVLDGSDGLGVLDCVGASVDGAGDVGELGVVPAGDVGVLGTVGSVGVAAVVVEVVGGTTDGGAGGNGAEVDGGRVPVAGLVPVGETGGGEDVVPRALEVAGGLDDALAPAEEVATVPVEASTLASEVGGVAARASPTATACCCCTQSRVDHRLSRSAFRTWWRAAVRKPILRFCRTT